MSKIYLALLFYAFLAGCTPSPEHVEAPLNIIVAYTWQPQSTLVHIAVAKGYFVAEGLAVQPQMHNYGKLALQSVLQKRADFATVAETPVMFGILGGAKIYVIANIEASSLNNGILARKSAGIATAQDLKGKRIAYTPGTTSEFFLDSLLTANGLARKQIQSVALKPEEMAEAMLKQRVDAVCTWNYPLTLIKQQLGSDGEIFYDREIYTETFNIAASQDFVQKNPETVKRFLRALLKAENFAAKHPQEAQLIMVQATKIDPDLIRTVWSNFNYRVVLDQTLLITLEDETRWAMANKLVEPAAMPDYRSYLHLDSLRAVKPEAIGIDQ